MPIFGQGAPGVRIRLRDLSETNLVINPNIVGGLVGHSTRGEFNTINDISSTSEIDVKLGSGFNSVKYNQALYAARAIINAGGFVEFVRPYGEAVITDDTDADYNTNQKLKTDTFLVQYDYSAATGKDSLSIDHYAATRYITDGLAGIGEREIYTIQEAIVENTNVNFLVDSGAVTDATTTGTKKIPLFAIMNTDPTSTTRAGDRLDITNITAVSGANTTVTTAQNHGLSVGDSVIIGGTTNFNGSFTVAVVASDKVFQTSQSWMVVAAETDGAVFVNEDAVTSGVDALQVKTVASGMSSKVYEYLELTNTTTGFVTDGDTVAIKLSNGTTATYEFQDDTTASLTTGSDYGVEIEQDAFVEGTDITSSTITVDNGTWEVGDIVRFTNGGSGTLDTALTATTTDYVVTANTSGALSIGTDANPSVAVVFNEDGSGTSKIFNITRTAQNLVDSVVANSTFVGSLVRDSFTGTDVDISTNKITVGNASQFTAADKVIFSKATNATNGVDDALPAGIVANTEYVISAVDLTNNTITCTGMDITAQELATNTYKVTNLSATNGANLAVNSNGYRVDFVGTFGLNIPETSQTDTASGNVLLTESATGLVTGTEAGATYIYVITATSTGILIDNTVGRNFVNLGLAEESYIDIDYDGTTNRVYTLNADGLLAAKIYLYVDYFFNGETYSFQGTIIPYVVGDANLYIAEAVLSIEEGWQFQINENAALEAAAEAGDFNLSQSVDSSDLIQSTFADVSLNASDPAIQNDVIWTYNPANNNSTTTLSAAWELFLDKDSAGADMLVAAGTAISNLFMRGSETINYTVMDGMLNICEKRKDMFCIFDGVDEKKVDVALDKMVGIGGQGDIARWGGIWDGRSLFTDSVYTKLTAEAVKSIEVAAVITQNRAGNAFWVPPAGYETGRIPGALAARQKYERTYNYAEDPNSDIAKLYDASINPTRVNDQGQVLYGQKTMLRRSTALNRMNVIMLVAGIHKRFASYLELKVFKLNTPNLRSNIVSDLQVQLDAIQTANPSGLTAGNVKCDTENNPQAIIDTNQLIVDVVLQPTRTSEYITLRTTVQRTGEDVNQITDVTII